MYDKEYFENLLLDIKISTLLIETGIKENIWERKTFEEEFKQWLETKRQIENN